MVRITASCILATKTKDGAAIRAHGGSWLVPSADSLLLFAHVPAMQRRRFLALIAATAVAAGQPRPPAGLDFSRVDVAPAKTSIYVGSVAMEMPRFERRDGGFESSYVARVFPFFFYNEEGRVRVEFTDAMLSRLSRGEAVDFTGLARRQDGAERRVEGRATPAAAGTGRLKLRVFYSKRVELIFNTTYAFPTSAAP